MEEPGHPEGMEKGLRSMEPPFLSCSPPPASCPGALKAADIGGAHVQGSRSETCSHMLDITKGTPRTDFPLGSGEEDPFALE